jgi:hypothetical protein
VGKQSPSLHKLLIFVMEEMNEAASEGKKRASPGQQQNI